MKKDAVTPMCEQCTHEEAAFISGQQVVAKNAVINDICVSAMPTLSPTLRKALALPFVKSINKQQVYHDTKLPRYPFDQMPVSSGNKIMAFADSNPAYVSAVGLLNRPVFGLNNNDLPNESAKTDNNVIDVFAQEGKDIYIAFLSNILDFFNAGGTNDFVRKCPYGQQGTTGGGGASYSNEGYTSNGVQWVIGSGGSGGGLFPSNGGGNGDDDDPFKNNRPTNLPRGHYSEIPFQAEEHLDQLSVEILQENDDLFRELGLVDQPYFELQLQPLPDQLSRSRLEDCSDPAPMTPMTPAVPIVSPAPPPTQTSDVQSLLEIQSLLMNPPNVQMTKPQQPTSPGYNNIPAAPVYNSQMQPPPSPLPQPVQQQQQQPSSSSDFFVITHCHNSRNRFIKMSIKNLLDSQAFEALQFSWNMHTKYEAMLKMDCTLPIATLGKAKLCNTNIDANGCLTFSLPVECVPLEEWVANNNDLRSRHLVIQQILNTLVVLFQGEDNLSFWGSFEVYVAPNTQVYIYVDFNKSLAVQKVYAFSGQSNSRIEDCKVLKRLFEMLLLPFMTNSLVSPQLRNILTTFQQLVSAPSSCINQITTMARVLGERRMCCMQAQIHGYNGQYVIYSVEHEPVSQSLGILKNMVLGIVQRPCIVLHEDNTFVNVTEVSARHTHGRNHNHRYVLMSIDILGGQRFPGALYIE